VTSDTIGKEGGKCKKKKYLFALSLTKVYAVAFFYSFRHFFQFLNETLKEILQPIVDIFFNFTGKC